MRPILVALVLLGSIASDAFATSGRTHTYFDKSLVPNTGGSRVKLNIPSNAVTSAAYDGERFLVAYTVDLVLHAAIFREAAAEPDVTVKLGDGPGVGVPAATWDGTRYVIFWNENGGRGAVVSRQGVIERKFTFSFEGWIVGVATSHSNIALLTFTSDETYAGRVYVTMFDSALAPRPRRLVGSLTKHLGASTYLYYPSIVPLGTGFFVAWMQRGRQDYEELVGTRVNAAGQPLDSVASRHDPNSVAGILLVPTREARTVMHRAALYVVENRVLAVSYDKTACAPRSSTCTALRRQGRRASGVGSTTRLPSRRKARSLTCGMAM